MPLRARCRSKARMSSKRCCQRSLPIKLLGQFLAREQFLVDAHDEHVFVMRAVEDADLAAARRGLMNAPEKIVRKFLRGRRLETGDAAALRVEAAHDMADRAASSRCIDRLQNNEQRPPFSA